MHRYSIDEMVYVRCNPGYHWKYSTAVTLTCVLDTATLTAIWHLQPETQPPNCEAQLCPTIVATASRLLQYNLQLVVGDTVPTLPLESKIELLCIKGTRFQRTQRYNFPDDYPTEELRNFEAGEPPPPYSKQLTLQCTYDQRTDSTMWVAEGACTAVRCPNPQQLFVHSTIQALPSAALHTKLQMFCDIGYYVDNSARQSTTIECAEDGTWREMDADSTTAPICTPVQCSTSE
uniref:Sushi domain-containing protein n=1 Tax=Lygus hesperus TaxID=30085 RepID=A0A146LAM2_LYGHE